MRVLPLVLVVACCGVGAAAVEACSSSDSSSSSSGNSSGGSDPEGGLGGGNDGATTDQDGATLEDGAAKDGNTETDGCAAPPPALDGGGGCGTTEFGELAVPFGPVGAGNTYVGGALQAGIYDAVTAERASGTKGSWHETLVIDGAGRFTRIRQIDTGASDASLGPLTRRSGTYTTSGTNITMTYDCAQSDGAFVDAGTDTLPYDALTSTGCGASYRYGVTGIRITLKRR